MPGRTVEGVATNPVLSFLKTSIVPSNFPLNRPKSRAMFFMVLTGHVKPGLPSFGAEPFTPQMAASMGRSISQGSLIHALLITPLNSATTKKGAKVEAVLSQPLSNGHRVVLPAGSRIKGVVLQARPAARLHHNGQLRIAFRLIVPPNGVGALMTVAVAML